eukprot:1133148-Pyramimonas_sp.AAC.1
MRAREGSSSAPLPSLRADPLGVPPLPRGEGTRSPRAHSQVWPVQVRGSLRPATPVRWPALASASTTWRAASAWRSASSATQRDRP